MNALAYIVLFACVAATGLAQSCWNDAVKEIHEACEEKVKKDNLDTEDKKTEAMFNCAMCKMEVTENDKINFTRLEASVDKYIVKDKQDQVKQAIKDCIGAYENAETNKVKAFYDCYGPKLYKEACKA